MVDRGRPGVKRRESVHVEGYRIESKDSLVTLQCTGSGTQRPMENGGASHQDKEVCERI